jgi:hypothetical protein
MSTAPMGMTRRKTEQQRQTHYREEQHAEFALGRSQIPLR